MTTDEALIVKAMPWWQDDLAEFIERIEAEAAAAERARLREAWNDLLVQLDELHIGGAAAAFALVAKGNMIFAEPAP